MKNDINKINMEELITEVQTNKKAKTKKEKLKDYSKKTSSSILLIPLIKPSIEMTMKLVRFTFPKQKIENYEEAIQKYEYTNEDINRAYKYNKLFRNIFATLSFLFLLYMIICVETKLQAIILSIGLVNLILFTLKHDLRVWQIENKKLCFFGYYLKKRFLRPIINTIIKEKR